MAELELLSNKELRQKCIEFGMPNVPVTDTSRKILIRRLEAVISGKPVASTPAKAARRKTMHVSKPSEEASSTEAPSNTATVQGNRPSRRTISVPERRVTITTTTVSDSDYSDVSPDRYDPQPVKSVPKEPYVTGSLYPKLEGINPSPKSQQLSKTGIVTTSYVQETAPIEQTVVNRDEDYIFKSVMKDKPRTTINDTTRSNFLRREKAPNSDIFSANRSFINNSRLLGERYKNQRNSLENDSEIEEENDTPNQFFKNRYENEVEVNYDTEDDKVPLHDRSPVKNYETPYLSEFARNLKRLQPTPLHQPFDSVRISPQKSALQNVYKRPNIRKTGNIWDSSVRQFIVNMEEKYHLKHSLILICVFMLAIFIYVFFIQSV